MQEVVPGGIALPLDFDLVVGGGGGITLLGTRRGIAFQLSDASSFVYSLNCFNFGSVMGRV